MGRTKIGKTTTVAYAFRNAAWITTERGGLIPVKRCLGFVPSFVWTQYSEDNPLGEFESILEKEVIPRARKGIIKTLVIDTLTTFTERLVAQLKDENKAMHGLYAFGLLQDTVFALIDQLRNLGIWVVLITHVKPPQIDAKTGVKSMGGPEFPGKALTRSLPARMDLVLMADAEQPKISGGSARRIIRCDPLDPDYLMGDRFGVTQRVQDMNLAPIIWRIKRPGQPVLEELETMKLNVLEDTASSSLGLFGN